MLKSTKKQIQDVLNQLFILKTLLATLVFTALVSCGAKRINSTVKPVITKLNGQFYNNQFTGVLVVDPQKKDTLIALNTDNYFIPASNVKIFTFYAGLKLIPDKIPTLKYLAQNDTLFFEGTGDPSWLHPYFKDNTALLFLNNFKNLAFTTDNFKDTKYGPGWAWEDYEFYYSPERSALPLYGNILSVNLQDSIKLSPKYFKDSVLHVKGAQLRQVDKNKFFIAEDMADTLEIPFKTSNRITKSLLQQQLHGDLKYIDSFPKGEKKELFGISTDSIYKRMLYESDNFLAEQLMMVASSTLSDSLAFTIARNFMLENSLASLKQTPRWVDGSGLSRYNLFTPESFVHVLTLLKQEISEDRLFHLFPTWNASGTITKRNPSDETPFIYAKSGGMGNVYNLSGYLKTKSGKLLIFSFMNNHFRTPSREVRQNMYDILKSIHERY